MADSQLHSVLAQLPERHRRALEWFATRAGTIQQWPDELADGTLLATRAKGIYKPAWTEYALSIRQTIGGPYPDEEPIRRPDGTWNYMYFQEGSDPTARDAAFTNKGLMACRKDGIPVGVMRQVSGKPDFRYAILGLALVTAWDGGYFHLEGFSDTGTARRPGSQGVAEGLLEELEASEEDQAFDPSDAQDHRVSVFRSIVRRRGQGLFRRALLERYAGTCVVTGCRIEAILEAAHIVAYHGEDSNHQENGLLLRADIHTLFDLGLLAVNEEDYSVILADPVRDSAYRAFHGQHLKLASTDAAPNREALRMHRVWAGL